MNKKYLITYALLIGVTFSMIDLKPIMATLFDVEKFNEMSNVPVFNGNNSDSVDPKNNILTDNYNYNSSSSSDIPPTNDPNQPQPQPQECEMPPCPPGQACIQMCP